MQDIHERKINGKMLKQIRTDAADCYGKVTIQETSKRSKLSTGYISDIEHNHKPGVSIAALHALAAAYHCYLDIRFIKTVSGGERTTYDLLD